MTNPTPTNSSPSNRNLLNLLNYCFSKIRQPKVLTTGLTLLSVSVVAYSGIRGLIRENLPAWLSEKISETLNREVKIGEVQSISPGLTSIKFGLSFLYPNVNNTNSVQIDNFQVNFNPLSLLISRKLNTQIILDQVDITAKQDLQGNWFNLKVEDINIPFDLDIRFEIQQGKLNLIRNTIRQPLFLKFATIGKYQKNQIEYYFDVGIANSQVVIEGKTNVLSGISKLGLAVEKLDLQGLVSLVSNFPITVDRGEVDANLGVDIFPQKQQFQVNGDLELSQFVGKISNLEQSLQANAQVQFNGNEIIFERGNIAFGEVTASLAGKLDWIKGFDVGIKLNPLNLKEFNSALPMAMEGEISGQFQLQGDFFNPIVTGKLTNINNLTLEGFELKEISLLFQSDLDRFTLKELKAIPVLGGKIAATGIIETKIRDYFNRDRVFDPRKIQANINFETQLPSQAIAQGTASLIASNYNQIPQNLQLGNFRGEGFFQGSLNNPQAIIKYNLSDTSLPFVGNLAASGKAELRQEKIIFTQDISPQEGGKILVRGEANLRDKKYSSLITSTANPISLLYSNQKITLEESLVNLSGKLDELSNLDGYGNINLNVHGSQITLNTQFNPQTTTILATASPMKLDQFLPQLSLPVTLAVEQAKFSSPSSTLISLLSQSETKNFQGIDAEIDLQIEWQNNLINLTEKLDRENLEAEDLLDLGVENSQINLTAAVAENQWKSEIIGASLPISWLCEKTNQGRILPVLNLRKISKTISYTNKPKICSQNYFDAQLYATGKLKPNQNFNHLSLETTTQLNIENAQFTAQGNLILANLNSNPDIKFLALDLITRLPLNYILSEAEGTAEFQGKIEGKNLLTTSEPLTNLALLGELKIENLAIQQSIFDPLLAGILKIVPGQKSGIELQGKQDKIIAWLEPCQTQKCQLPYVPISLDFRQGENTDSPIFIRGKRENNSSQFKLIVENFPLNFLNITPASKWGSDEPIHGKVNGNLALNIYSLSSVGDLQVKTAGISSLNLDEINISFDYNSELALAKVSSASLKFGDSEYQFIGDLNLKSGKINAKLDIPKSSWQDLLTVLQIHSAYSLIAFLSGQQQDKNPLEKLNNYQLGYGSISLSEQLNLLWKIDQKIQENAQKLRVGKNSVELDLTGNYFGTITLAGTWYDPQIQFNLKGDNWQWQTRPSIIDLIQPLGLVVKQLPVIPVNNFDLSGKLGNGILEIYPSSINIGEASISGQALIKKEGENFTFDKTNFRINNLSLDLVDNFIDIPIDITSKFDTNLDISGTWNNPQINGEFEIKETAIIGRAITEKIAGKFSYHDSHFSLQTNTPSSIQIKTELAYSSEFSNLENLAIDINLLPSSIKILEKLSGGSLAWADGEGELKLQIRKEKITDPINVIGEIIFNNALLQIYPLSEELNLNGKIVFNNQILTIDSLEGKVRDNYILLAGALPLYKSSTIATKKPLTITLEQGKIDRENLYKGKLDSQLVITGTATSPIIGGKVNLYDGIIFVSQRKAEQQKLLDSQTWLKRILARINLSNLDLAVKNIELTDNNIFSLDLVGNINLNGNLGNIARLQPQGEIILEGGDFNLFTTQLFITRRHQNKIIFYPEQSLFNPFLDLQLKTFLFDISLKPIYNQEIPDDIVKSGRAKTVEITVSIQGNTEEILPTFAKQVERECQIKPENIPPIHQLNIDLNQLSNCLKVSSFTNKINLEDLAFLPSIKLESSPPLTQTEIYTILGQQSSSLFTSQIVELQSRNQAQLLEIGFTQIILSPIISVVGFELNENLNDIGENVGLPDFRIFPIIETNYQVGQESHISVFYDYNFSEVQIRYNQQF